MNEWKVVGTDRKCVIVEIADVFFEMKYPCGQSMESIPDNTLIEDDAERKKQTKIVSLSERKAQMKVLRDTVAKARNEGYKYFRLLTVEQVRHSTGRSLPLGLNGMYLLLFWVNKNEKAKNAYETTDEQYLKDYFKDWTGDED
jgi:hypothetical protein